MIEFIDSRGVPVRVQDAAEADELETALTGILGMEFDPLPLLQRREVRCPISRLIESVVRLSSMEDRQIQQATLLLGSLDPEQLNPRERGHLAACNHWVNQDYDLAHACWRELLVQHPRDIVALFSVHMLEFNMGWTERMRETVVAIRPFWGPAHPLYGYVRGIEAFALVENGDYDAASIAAECALAINPRDIYAIHAACHVGYERGQYAQTLKWLDDTERNWADNLCMRIHLWWHHALFNLYMQRPDAVLQTFHQKIRIKNDPDGYEDLDAVSLLWRLSLTGVDVSELWQEVAQYWMPSIDQSQYWFNDVHSIMAMASSNHQVLVQRILRRIDATYAKVPMIANVTRTVCRGLIAFQQEDYDSALELLSKILPAVRAIGGSNAQRDLLELTTIEAAIRARQFDRARQLIQQGRSLRHPSPFRTFFVDRLQDEEPIHLRA
ncbi:tetratricopeptide repeat protein [Pseudomonas sp. ICMP22404]|uniref:tetratricopeptide repeat protein n=1 Tax=Pseudomonas TaxID=286 RepID=UPI00111AAF1D|nr:MULTISPECIES: tetratricopeptide repeat protein [Pseudomonas]MCI0994429.1 tetratricopeptide repeat protein [Pseudomonas corrugata]NUT68421.1 tetratricopeptide repeat protein [Pseudomonas corrugata]TNF79449.1 tetratricopeptide repeat protein [Pseudomonas sp. ICMP22404]